MTIPGLAPETAAVREQHKQLRRQAERADRDPGGYARRRRVVEIALAILFPAAIFVFWQIGSVNGWWSRTFYPAPSDQYRQALDRWDKLDLWGDIWATLYRVFWGYFWGVLFGLLFAFVLGKVRVLRKMTEPTLNALYTIPKITLISPFLIIFGFKDKPIIILIAVTVFFFVWVPIQHAVMTVPASQREAANSFGASSWQEFRHVTLPSTLPQIFVQLRVAASVAFLAVFGFEAVFTPSIKGEQHGLGYMINATRASIDMKSAYAGIIIAALLGVIASALISFVGRLATPWADDERS
jgi:ABC-type nitrate/sulfonate/bicarbonate transport system permease component